MAKSALIGIYSIINRSTNDIYVGASINIQHRWSSHKKEANEGKHHSSRFQEAWTQHGPELFEFQIIELCDKTEIQKREQHYLDTLDPAYNMSKTSNYYLRNGLSQEEAFNSEVERLKSSRKELMENGRRVFSCDYLYSDLWTLTHKTLHFDPEFTELYNSTFPPLTGVKNAIMDSGKRVTKKWDRHWWRCLVNYANPNHKEYDPEFVAFYREVWYATPEDLFERENDPTPEPLYTDEEFWDLFARLKAMDNRWQCKTANKNHLDEDNILIKQRENYFWRDWNTGAWGAGDKWSRTAMEKRFKILDTPEFREASTKKIKDDTERMRDLANKTFG